MPDRAPDPTSDASRASRGQSPARPSEYVLGTNPAELQRLGFQHRLWAKAAYELWHRARIGPGLAALDIGCGPGFASFDLAHLVGPTGRVVGIDESEPFIAHANSQAKSRDLHHARFFVADAGRLDGLETLAESSFDLAYLRWVFCFVPDPGAVLDAIYRLLKPGGRLLVQDYFRYETMCIAPRSEAFERVIAAIARSWRDRAGDPDIMGRLPAMAADRGMTIDHLDRIDPGPARPGSTMWNWPDTFWRVFLPRLEEMRYISPEERAAFLDAWEAACGNPAAYMHLPPMYEMISVK